MRVSYLWLKDLVEFSLTPEETAQVLTMVGLEVETLEPVGPDLEGIFVGRILEVNPHPNADKLTLCKVDTGEGVVEFVCGAPNVRVGQKVPCILAGGTLPTGMKIESRAIRGVRSSGMICSEQELGLGEDHEGIMVLETDVEVGRPLQEVFGPRDWAMELEITLNRPDCLSHEGVARELAAALRLDFELPRFQVEESGVPIERLTRIAVEDSQLCPRYSARVIQGVKVAPSPDWMRRRLEAAGLRSINNIVDVTNYVMLQTGHPMHAFDFNRLEGRRIVVRRASAGETFITLDEIERHLDERMLLICDARRGVALAGVMGGLNSEISDDTTDLLLESAYFDPVNTRRTSRILNLITDSSKRFERGADPNATVRALDMAASLIKDLAGGDIARGVLDVYPEPIRPRTVKLRPERVKTILGIGVDTDEMKEHLIRLGCSVSDADPLEVTVPTSRFDLEREIDLIEDVARLHGYDKVPTADRARISLDIPQQAADVFLAQLRDALVKLGFSQVTTSPLISEKEASFPGYPPPVRLRNPGSEDMAYLCNGLFPGLLKVAAHNLNRNIRDFRIFEINRVFDAGNREWDSVAGLIAGVTEPQKWDQPKIPVHFLDLKGFVELLVQEISLDNVEFIPYNIEQGQRFTADALEARSGDVTLGFFGRIHPDLLTLFDIEGPIFGFEFNAEALQAVSRERVAYRPFPKYPALQRDLAFVVKDEITAGQLRGEILTAGGKHLSDCELFDLYRGQQVGEGNKSLAFRLNFQATDHTLTDEEADEAITAIINRVQKRFGAKLRS
jgi:phenylalanyl-tRNA synthetase beta chain